MESNVGTIHHKDEKVTSHRGLCIYLGNTVADQLVTRFFSVTPRTVFTLARFRVNSLGLGEKRNARCNAAYRLGL
jgi:hypothetical protein